MLTPLATLTRPEPATAQDDAGLQARCCDLLVEGGRVSALIGVVVGLALTCTMRGAASDTSLLAWNVLMVVATALRLLVSQRWKTIPVDQRNAAVPPFLRRYRSMVFLSGMLWGGTILLCQGGDLARQVILAFALAGISAGGMAALSIDRWSVVAFLGPTVLPLVLHFLSGDRSIPQSMGLMGLMYLGFVGANSLRSGGQTIRNLRLEQEAEAREQHLRESEDRLKRAQQVAQLGSFDWNLATGEMRWSDEHYRLWGLTPGELSPSIQTFSRGVHPDDRDRVRAIVLEAARSGHGYDCMHRVKRPDGSVIHVQERAEAIHDESGRAVRIIGTVQDITARRTAEERIRHLAFYDPLTGLPNRHLLLERLQTMLGRPGAPDGYGALFFIDLDNFKNLNDTYGHDQGDVLLQLVARRLQGCVGGKDLVARLGGDEFVVLLDELGPDRTRAMVAANEVGQSILTAMQLPYALPARQYHSTSSLGVAMCRVGTTAIEDILKRADLAMYQAKAAGRNTLCFFTPEMQAKAVARSALEADLRVAVANQAFELYLQGQVDAAGVWTGAEVLLRWPHPVRGMVSPAELIPIAEDSGLILPIGQWVLERACALLVEWSSIPELAHLTIAVNVSARQFRQELFVAEVLEVLRRSGANPQRLKLELTESLLLVDVEGAIARMTELREHGVGFALDDFGIGYSSLSYLKRLPLVQLKIDKTFVQDVLDDPNDAAIARMILTLGHSLGLEVIAEGVETEGQRAFLAASGCEAYQGFLFSRPLPIAAFRELVCPARRAPALSIPA